MRSVDDGVEVVAMTGGGSELLDRTTTQVQGPLRALVIDDVETVRATITDILTSFGAEVRSVDTAARACATVGDFKPHLVISDVFMPDQDGIELISELKGRGSFPDLIFVTGSDPFYAKSACMIAQGNGFRVRGFVLKPFRMSHFKEFIDLYEVN